LTRPAGERREGYRDRWCLGSPGKLTVCGAGCYRAGSDPRRRTGVDLRDAPQRSQPPPRRAPRDPNHSSDEAGL